MWWGYSPALDFQKEIKELRNLSEETSLDILIIGASDARHIVKTIASLYTHKNHLKITFHVIETSLQEIARSIFLLSTCLEKELGLQEATRYYLEILGNTLLRPATAKYLISRAKRLIDVLTNTLDCDWLDLTELRYKERDLIELIFQFWAQATRDNIPTSQYWDFKVRRSLGSRYDYKDGAFDWDYYMVLKPRDLKYLTIHEYKFWRESGVAFYWLEGEPVRGNSTFITSNEIFRLNYAGDVKNGPFFTWMSITNENDKNLRASDMAEKEVMRAIYEIKNREPMDDEKFAAHRDSSILTGTIVMELVDPVAEQESWSENNKFRQRKDDLSWVSIPQVKVVFHQLGALQKFTEKNKYSGKFDCIWLAQNVSDKIPLVTQMLKPDCGVLLTETRKFMAEFRNEQVEDFMKKIRICASENGLREVEQKETINGVIHFYKE